MPAKRRPPISVLGVLTKDGWDHRQKESRNLYQTQTIGDIISWMSFRRNRQAGHQMPDYLPRKCLKDLREKHSVSVINDGDTINNFCSKYNVYEKHVITYINRIDIRKDIRGTKEARGTPDIHGLQIGRHPYWKWQDRKFKGKRTWLLPERTRTDHYW